MFFSFLHIQILDELSSDFNSTSPRCFRGFPRCSCFVNVKFPITCKAKRGSTNIHCVPDPLCSSCMLNACRLPGVVHSAMIAIYCVKVCCLPGVVHSAMIAIYCVKVCCLPGVVHSAMIANLLCESVLCLPGVVHSAMIANLVCEGMLYLPGVVHSAIIANLLCGSVLSPWCSPFSYDSKSVVWKCVVSPWCSPFSYDSIHMVWEYESMHMSRKSTKWKWERESYCISIPGFVHSVLIANLSVKRWYSSLVYSVQLW